MNKFWIVAMHTYLSKVKAKSFIISTAIMVVIMLVVSNLPTIIGYFDKGNDNDTVGVHDQTGEYESLLKTQLESTKSKIVLKTFSSETDLQKALKENEIVGYLLLRDEDGLPAGIYKANNLSNSALSTEIQTNLQQIKTARMTEKLAISEEMIASLYAPVSYSEVALDENAKSQEELNAARGLVYVLLFVIYIGVLMYASMIATEVAVEKTSRVMEILISSVPPIQQMFAKIIGIALLSMTQMAVFFVVGYISFKQSNIGSENNGFFEVFGFGNTSLSTIMFAVVFTLLGYFLYATLAACLGSLVSRIEDMQQMITPMTMLVVIGFMIAMFGLGNPSASFITVTSFIPFFTPMIMFLRIGMLEIPMWEVLTGIAIMLASIAILGVFGAKVYKGGVLMYGKSSSLKDIKKALQLSRKD